MLKNELKNKIINEIENNNYYEIKYDDEITNNDKITINKTQYNIHTIVCIDCENETRFITPLTWCDLRDALIDDGVYYDYDGDLVCDDCKIDHYAVCDNCGDLINLNSYDYITLYDDRVYCDNCRDFTFTCDDCGYTYDTRETDNYYTNNGDTICDDCYNDHCFTCSVCGDVYHVDDACYDDDDNVYCYDCYNDKMFDYNNVNTDVDEICGNINDEQLKSAVRGYHDTPRDFIKRVASDENINDCKLFYGVELETSANNYNVQKNASVYVASNLNCIIENDSSVSGYAMEIISDPQTLKKWYERRNKIATIFNDLKNVGVTSHDNNTCGLHVHVSRDGLGETIDEQTRVINNIILILENFKQNIIKLTRRDAEQLNRWSQFLSDYNGDDLRDVEKIKKCDKGGRYLAVNLNNYKTIEFRIFRGTLNVDTFYATLELVNNIITLAKRDDIRGVSFKQLVNLNNTETLQKYAKERQCDNSVTIINRENKTRYIENKKRREQLKAVVRTNVLRTNIFTDLLQYADTIDDALNYIDRSNARRDIEKMLNIPRDTKREIIYKNYNELLNVFKYNCTCYYGAKVYEYLNNDNMKKARNLYNELVAIIKAVI